MLLCNSLTMVGNLFIVVTINFGKALNSLMHFYLVSLSFMNLTFFFFYYSQIDFRHFFWGGNTISSQSCMIQLLTEQVLEGSEIVLLLVMFYDFSVAISKPLNYLVIMKQSMCVVLLVVSWVGSFLHSVIEFSTIHGLPFCDPNVADHYICDNIPLIETCL